MSNYVLELPQPKERQFLPRDFKIENWNDFEPYANNLLEREINSGEDLYRWLADWNEAEAVISEHARWLMIKMTCNTGDETISEAYKHFTTQISPNLSRFTFLLDKKLLESKWIGELDFDTYYVFLRSVKKSVELYREKNLSLYSKLSLKQKEYGIITGMQTINLDGKELTMQRAARLLQKPKREERERVHKAMTKRRLTDAERLDVLFEDLLEMRHQVALNTDYDNFRDYKFASLGRFDYTPDDCFEFHDAIAVEIVPFTKQIMTRHKKMLGVERLRPWDTSVDPSGKPALKPFSDSRQLIDKTIACLSGIHPQFGGYLGIMDEMGYLDLESRKGKMPGGYNCSLPEIGVPFIFMNAVGSMRDVITMVHEAGHAIHAFLTRDHKLNTFKNPPSEVNELASMSMELISMEHWGGYFFDNEADLRRARIDQLEKVLLGLPRIAKVDNFQHWLYLNPKHNRQERHEKWISLNGRYGTNIVDYEGVGELRPYGWQYHLHIYEVPFYYIEYAMAQLGAIAMWRQYRQNPEQALQNYIKALSLGYTKPIGEIYEAAGIRFDFSREYVRELGEFVMAELHKLYNKVQ